MERGWRNDVTHKHANNAFDVDADNPSQAVGYLYLFWENIDNNH